MFVFTFHFIQSIALSHSHIQCDIAGFELCAFIFSFFALLVVVNLGGGDGGGVAVVVVLISSNDGRL